MSDYEEMGFAKLDTQREKRTGFPEVVFCEGKPDEYLIRGDNTWVIEHVPKDTLLATMTGFYRRAEGHLITRNNLFYRLYQLMLPCIRSARRLYKLIKRILRKLH